MTITATDALQDAKHRSRRGDQLEREAREELRQLEIAETVAGPEPAIRTDGSGEPAESADELEQLHIGDHVQDCDDPDATMVVVGLPVASADEYEVGGQTIAEYNPDYDATDDVIEVIYPQRTDVDIRPIDEYAFPRGRLERVAAVHDEGGEE